MSRYTSLLQRVSGKSRKRRPRAYQEKRTVGTEERQRLILPHIEKYRCLLDIGCNAGVLTAFAADAGLFCLGLEAEEKFVQIARQQCTPERALSYMQFLATPDSVHRLPSFDVVFCLSVYHHWHRQFGHDDAQEMLRVVGTKAKHRLLFEPASIQSKYGPNPPIFVENDENSIVTYTTDMLTSLFNGKADIEYGGPTTCIGREAYRYLFIVKTENLST